MRCSRCDYLILDAPFRFDPPYEDERVFCSESCLENVAEQAWMRTQEEMSR